MKESFLIQTGGKTLRIYRRKTPKGLTDNFFVRYADNVKSLKTSLESIAADRARMWFRKLTEEAWARKLGIIPEDRKPTAERKDLTIEKAIELFKAHRNEGTHQINPKTVDANCACLRSCCLKALGKDWQTKPLTALNRSFITNVRKAFYKSKGLNISKDEDLSLNGTINSTIAQARSVFAKAAMHCFEGYKIPDLSEWLEMANLDEEDHRFEPLTPNEEEAIMTRLNPDHKDWPGFRIAIAVEMARYCGLTKKEIEAISWDWITPDGTQIIVKRREGFRTKRNTKNGDIPLNPERFEKWKAWANGDKSGIQQKRPDDRIVGAIGRPASEWLSIYLNPNRTKKLHDLRKQAGSDFYQKTKDIHMTSRFLRDSIKTIIKHYVSPLDSAPSL
jgi:hypothetical protein